MHTTLASTASTTAATAFSYLPELHPGAQLERFLPHSPQSQRDSLPGRHALRQVPAEPGGEAALWRRKARRELVDALLPFALNNWTPQDVAHLLSPLARHAVLTIASAVAERLRHDERLDYATYLAWSERHRATPLRLWQDIEACERATERLAELTHAGRADNWLPTVTHATPTASTPVLVGLMRKITALRARAEATTYAAESRACAAKAALLEDELGLMRIRKARTVADGPAAIRVFAEAPWLSWKFRTVAALAAAHGVNATLVEESGIIHVTGSFSAIECFRADAATLTALFASSAAELSRRARSRRLNPREVSRGFYQGLATTVRAFGAAPLRSTGSHQQAAGEYGGQESSFDWGLRWGINSGVSFVRDVQRGRHSPSTSGVGPEAC